MEFSVGAGVYPAKYGQLLSTAHNGPLAYTDRKTYVGLDQTEYFDSLHLRQPLGKGGKG